MVSLGEMAIMPPTFYRLFGKVLGIENSCHLSIDTAKRIIITIRRHSISTLHSILVTAESHRCLAHVAVGTPQKIVGCHPLVGCAMVVEIVNNYLMQTI